MFSFTFEVYSAALTLQIIYDVFYNLFEDYVLLQKQGHDNLFGVGRTSYSVYTVPGTM